MFCLVTQCVSDTARPLTHTHTDRQAGAVFPESLVIKHSWLLFSPPHHGAEVKMFSQTMAGMDCVPSGDAA